MNTIKTETTSKINSLNTNNEYEDEIPDDIVCPLTNKIMSEPVFAADGYSYECEAIQKYFVNANASNRNVKAKENKNKEILSPKTNQPFQHTNIAPNHNLKQRIEKYHSQANDMSLNSKGQSVEHEKGQFEILIEQANAPIFGIDVDGNVNVWNKMAEKITGFEKVEVIGHNLVDEFITPAFRDAVRNVLEQALISNETSNFEFPLITKSNNRVEVLLNATTRRDIKDNIIGVVGIGQDITLLKAVLHEKGQYVVLIEHANAPIFGIDVDGNVNVWNKMTEKITGFEKVEVIGHNLVDEFITPEFRDAVRNVLEQALIGNEMSNFEFPLITKSHDRVEVLLNATTRRDVNCNITGVVGIGQDITLRKTAEIAKKIFLASFSHELRTPLNGLLGMLELLREEHLSDSAHRKVILAHNSSTLLLNLINDILDLSKIEAEQLIVNIEPFDIRVAIASACEILTTALSEKGIALEITVSDKVSTYLVGDVMRVRQILINLLSNAIKFTPEGKIHVKCWCDEDNSETTTNSTTELNKNQESDKPLKQRLYFEVTDTGVGMLDADMLKLFSLFTKIYDSRITNRSGSGLGLAICKKLCNLMNGDISVHSQYGVGTTLAFNLLFDKYVASKHAEGLNGINNGFSLIDPTFGQPPIQWKESSWDVELSSEPDSVAEQQKRQTKTTTLNESLPEKVRIKERDEHFFFDPYYLPFFLLFFLSFFFLFSFFSFSLFFTSFPFIHTHSIWVYLVLLY
jgi:PAS domain S-box-containing protein